MRANEACSPKLAKRAKAGPQAASLPVVIGAGSHPFPFRTRKLSLLPPMVLHGKLCGRVGRCRHYFSQARVSNRFAGFRLYAGSQARRTQFPMRCMGSVSSGRLACSAAVWESRSLPALSQSPRSIGSRAFVCTPAARRHTQFPMRCMGSVSLGRLACSAAVWESRSLPALSVKARCRYRSGLSFVHLQVRVLR